LSDSIGPSTYLPSPLAVKGFVCGPVIVSVLNGGQHLAETAETWPAKIEAHIGKAAAYTVRILPPALDIAVQLPAYALNIFLKHHARFVLGDAYIVEVAPTGS
jgi:hypothetical protein